MITDIWFYCTAIPAVLVYGIGKGGFGGALGVIAVPLMALTTPPFQAASILLPILIAMDVFAVRYHYKNCDYSEIKLMLPTAVLGIVVASFIMGVVTGEIIQLFVGGISLLFCLQYYMKGNGKQTNKYAGRIWSFVSGISSTMIHAGGGPISIYLLPKNLDKKVMVATMAVFFCIMNLIKLVPYTYFGQFDHQNLLTSLVLIPLAPVGVKLGIYLLQVISQEQVYKICYLLLALSGGKLFYSGVMGLIA
ncbi:sulfite exporter TauE/SafE family protein [Vibrio sp. DW001]|uniref:sulfite exporter TauE/SafE family protein n=1 Tax=Vibrio sp. DW001 TaxID=2912315 RepID=UPI0023AF9747|nr:sulfite exporter TauE/SafE family protein [Vibrio sp. DW001]WED25833.1 sulfite exporter TauE/SafE family protein [Vibrio sp. DW001]